MQVKVGIIEFTDGQVNESDDAFMTSKPWTVLTLCCDSKLICSNELEIYTKKSQINY